MQQDEYGSIENSYPRSRPSNNSTMDSKSRRRKDERRVLKDSVNTSRERLNTNSLGRNGFSSESPLSSRSDRNSPESNNSNAFGKDTSQHSFINDLLSCFDNEIAEQTLNKKLSIMTLRRLDKSAAQKAGTLETRKSSKSPRDHLKSPTEENFSEQYHTLRTSPRSPGKFKVSTKVGPEQLMPDMDSKIQNALNNTTPRYKNIASKAAKEQAQVQSLFRNMCHVTIVNPPRDLEFNIPAPPLEPPLEDDPIKIPKRQFGASRNQNVQDVQFDEETARRSRLAALGIFELAPQCKQPKSAITQSPIKSFATPQHQKAEKRDKIDNIEGPVLVSTSSNVQTVPISEIIKDLKTLGRLV